MTKAACTVLAVLALAGCDSIVKSHSTAEPPSSAAPAETTATAPPAAPGANDTADKQNRAGTAAANPAPTAAKGPTTTVTDGQKKITSDGQNTQLKNESGSGSVTKSGGTTTVTGKSGKSIKIPMP